MKLKVEGQLVFIEAMYGIGKNSKKPYHLIKLADPVTYENHVISFDPAFIVPEKIDIQRGQKVELTGRLATPFDNTTVIATSIKVIS